MFFTASKIFFLSRVISILIFDDFSLMHDSDVIIQTVFMRFDFAKSGQHISSRLTPWLLCKFVMSYVNVGSYNPPIIANLNK